MDTESPEFKKAILELRERAPRRLRATNVSILLYCDSDHLLSRFFFARRS
jgi:hypothetical protein